MRDTLHVLLNWFFLFFFFSALGAPFILHQVKRKMIAADWFRSFWVGWALSLGLLMGWSVLAPINRRAFLAISLLAVLGAVTAWFLTRSHKSARPVPPRRWLYAGWAFCGVSIVWAAARSLFGVTHEMTDAGVYHLSAINWANAFPTVLGMGGFNHRVGYGNSSFLYCAFINAVPGALPSYYVANGLVLIVTLFQIVDRLLSAKARSAEWYFHLVLLTAWGSFLFPNGVTPDEPSYALTLVLAIELIAFFGGQAVAGFSILVLSAALITVKLNGAVFAAGASLLVVGSRGPLKKSLRESGLGLILAAGLLTVWVVRNLKLTGYLVYPVPLTRLPVDWAMPVEMARAEIEVIRRFGRTAATALFDVSWLPNWLRYALLYQKSELGIRTLTIVVAFLLGKKFVKQDSSPPVCRALVWLSIFSVVYWFVMGPQPRFVRGPLLILLAATAGFALPYLPKVPRWALGTLLFLCFLGAAKSAGVIFSPVSTSQPVDIGKIRWVTNEKGFSSWEGMCWNAPYPCTPYLIPGLELRNPPEMADGFRVNPQPPVDYVDIPDMRL